MVIPKSLHKMSQMDAYRLGVRNGRVQGREDSFITNAYILLAAMDFERDEEIITDEYFKDYGKRVENRINLIMNDVFEGDLGKAVEAAQNPTAENVHDKAKYLIHKINELRSRYGWDKV